MKTRTADFNRSTSNLPWPVLNLIKLSDARLQAVLSRKRYSEHGLVEFCRSVPLQVCHLWIVESNCIPGSPQMYVPSATFRSSTRASLRSHLWPSVTRRVHHSRPSCAASMNSSLTRTLTFSFWYITEPYASPL